MKQKSAQARIIAILFAFGQFKLVSFALYIIIFI